jgi:nucleoid-associated protein YgaU
VTNVRSIVLVVRPAESFWEHPMAAAFISLSHPTTTAAPHPAYWRRRLVVVALAIVLVGTLLSAAGSIAAAFGDVPASVPGRRPAQRTYLVQPGDTLWSIARSYRPTGDVNGLVTQLERLNGAALRVGQRIMLP